jgi:hypothetical protein
MRFIRERLGDFIAALVTGGVGLFLFTEAFSYRMGTLQRMGPGYMPWLLGLVMLGLSVLMVLTARPSKLDLSLKMEQLRGIIFLGAALGAFALTIERFGLLVSIFLTVFLAALASPRTPLLGALALAVGTAVVSTLLFRVGLGLQMRAF